MAAVRFDAVDILFGRRARGPDPTIAQALALLDQGLSREQILERTGTVLGVAGATLAVEKGEICVLMGLSGSGKSTLLRAVNGLNAVQRGSVLIEHEGQAVDVTRCGRAMLRELRQRRVAMVFQQFALLPWRTVRENVGLGLELRGMSAPERARIVEEKLTLVGLERWADKYASQLSGGMQQRVGLSRAFATDADILLMDEPFSALDPLIRAKLQDELLELQRRLHKTIIFVSHDLDEALKLGNRIAIMEGGRIVQAGPPEEIVLNPASGYVREFVQHVNPMTVLRGRSLMAAAKTLAHDRDGVLLCPMRQLHLALDAAGRPAEAWRAGKPVTVTRIAEDGAGAAPDRLAVMPADALMRAIVRARQESGLPVVLVEGERFVGLCDDAQIYRALCRDPAEGGAPAADARAPVRTAVLADQASG